ncbi:MAG: hypothetical protein U0802_21605 [Candidatus Binatia bacterium]
MTPTRTVTPTATATPTRTETRTPTPTVPRPFGPEITYFGIASADNVVRTPNGQTNDGVPLYDWPTQAGFIIVVEGRPGTNNRPLATCGTMGAAVSRRAAVQLLADRPLGNGSTAVCDTAPPDIGGVPAVQASTSRKVRRPPTPSTISPAVSRSSHPKSEDACTFDELGNFSFVRNRSGDPVKTTIQFCSAPAIGGARAFKSGVTRLKVQLLDAAGNIGSRAELAVRVPVTRPHPVPEDSPCAPLSAAALCTLLLAGAARAEQPGP